MLGQLMEANSPLAPEGCAVHVVPPSVVARIPPKLPTAKQLVVLGQLTPYRAYEVESEASAVQFVPPSCVASIMPHRPTATQVVASAQLIASEPYSPP